MKRDNRHAPSAPHRKHAPKKVNNDTALAALIKSEDFQKLSPTNKLVAMLAYKKIDELLAAGLAFNAKVFGERVGYSYDHVRRLCRAGKIDPKPVMLGAGKVWKEYFFLPEHVAAVFAQKPS